MIERLIITEKQVKIITKFILLEFNSRGKFSEVIIIHLKYFLTNNILGDI